MRSFDQDLRRGQIYNAIINGNFDIWQRGATITRTNASLSTGYLADRAMAGNGGTSAKSITINRSTQVPTSAMQSLYSYEMVNNTAVASLATTDSLYPYRSYIEGNTFAPVIGNDFTIGFWLYSSFSGVVSVALRNVATTLSFVSNLTVTSGWNYCSVIVPWNNSLNVVGTSAAVEIFIGAISGSTYQTATVGSWTAGSYLSSTTATNWAATVGSTLRISQLQLRPGQWSPDDMKNSFITTSKGPAASEYEMCLRYCYVVNSYLSTGTYMANKGVGLIYFPVLMRATPTISNPSITDVYNNSASTYDSATTLASTSYLKVGLNVTTAVNTSGAANFSGTLDADY